MPFLSNFRGVWVTDEYSNLEMPQHLKHHCQNPHFKMISIEISIAASVFQ